MARGAESNASYGLQPSSVMFECAVSVQPDSRMRCTMSEGPPWLFLGLPAGHAFSVVLALPTLQRLDAPLPAAGVAAASESASLGRRLGKRFAPPSSRAAEAALSRQPTLMVSFLLI